MDRGARWDERVQKEAWVRRDEPVQKEAWVRGDEPVQKDELVQKGEPEPPLRRVEYHCVTAIERKLGAHPEEQPAG